MVKILSILFIAFNLTFASITITQKQQSIEDFILPYHYDKHQTLTIDEIDSLDMPQTIKSQFTHGYTMADVWYKLTVTNISLEKDFIVYLTEPFFEKANFYYFEDGWKSFQSGLFTPLEKRIIKDSNPAFPITLQYGETKTFYLQTFAQLPNYGEIKIFSKDKFLTADKLNFAIGYMFFFGGLTIIIIINGFLFISLREKIYFYYLGYVFFYTLFVFIFSGFNLYVGLMPWHYQLHIVTPLFIFFLIKFSIEFLNLQYYAKRVSKLLTNIGYAYLIIALFMFFKIEPWFQINSSISTLVFILLIYSIYKSWKGGHKKAKLYFIAISFYIITITLLASLVNGWVENNDITRYSFLFGSFIEMIFFTLILANRFYEIKNEKINLQKNMLLIKEKNQKILQAKVKLRTTELEQANQKLTDQTTVLQATQKKLQQLNDTLEEKVKHSVQDVRKKDKLLQQQSRLAQMGEMISMIAHQWRQPLASINSVVLAIQTKLLVGKDLADEKQREEYLIYCNKKYENIKEYINYLSTTIDDFRDFFKPDKQQEVVPITNPITKALKITSNSLKSKSIELEINYLTNENVKIYQNEMIQVILNILKNAEDILLEKKIIHPTITINVYKENENIVIQISDNGGGIPDNIINKIFDPYFSTKDEKNGTGLGLYMSKLIVEKHNHGVIGVSNHQDGASFYIKLKSRSLQ